MARFIEMMTDTYTDGDMSLLADKLNQLINTAGTGTHRTMTMAGLFFNQSGYSRTPTVSASWMQRYAPFRLIGAMLSHSTQLTVPNSPKGHGIYLDMSRITTTDPDQMRRTLNAVMTNGCGWNYDQDFQNSIEKHYVTILHATQTTEFETCITACTEKGLEHNALLSTMLTPSPNTLVRAYDIPADPGRGDVYGSRIVIVINKLSVMLMHKLVALLPVIFKIALPTLTVAPDTALMSSFANMDADTFITKGLQWIDNVTRIHTSLLPLVARRTLNSHIEVMRTNAAQAISGRYTSRVRQLTTAIDSAEADLRNKYFDLKSLRILQASGNTETIATLCDFLSRVPDLVDVQAYSTDEYIFIIRTTLQHYEQESAGTVVRNHIRMGNVTTARMIKYLFQLEEYQVVIQHAFRLSFGEIPRGERGYTSHAMPSPFNADTTCLRNPHLNNFYNGIGCWGENGPMVTSALQRADYLTAFNLGIAAVRSINLLDGAASDYLWQDLNSNTKRTWRCIRRVADGTILSIEEFKEEIKRKDEGEQTNETDTH